MTARDFSWLRLLGGGAIGAACSVIILFICALATSQLLGGDEGAGTLASVMIYVGTPVALVAGAAIGGRVWGWMDLRLLAAVGGAMIGLVVIYLLAIPVSIIYGGAIDPDGVGYLLFYGLPIAVILGARWGWRRFERARQTARTD